MANVFAGVSLFPNVTYKANVEFNINIGLNQIDKILKQLIVNLLMMIAYSLFLKANNLFVK